MDDKIFELLEKMYSDIKKRFDAVDGHIIRLENEHGHKLDALFDGYKQSYEKLQEHDNRFDDIDSKLDNLSLKVINHDSKLEVLEGGRKK